MHVSVSCDMLEVIKRPQQCVTRKRNKMKPLQHNTPSTEMTTLPQVISWHISLQHLHACLACCFARPEPYARALRYVQAILSTIECKNGWQIAEQAREATPYGMQRLLSQAVWDELVRQGKLKKAGHGTYELAPE